MQRAFNSIFFSTLPIATLGCLIPLSTQAQVTPDNTTSTIVNQNGNNFIIEQGDRVGDNLFHSFNEFSVPTLGSAAFNNAGDIANIFSRVTGSSISSIDGLISANGAANLFLINPNGIIFGQNASLNLGGSFFASTADSLLFEGNIEFSASNPQAPPLLEVSIPIGASFRDNPGDITNRSRTSDSTGTVFNGLNVQPGKNISLIGGDVSLDGGIILAPGGGVELGGLNTAGTIEINVDGSLSFPENVERGNVFLRNSSGVGVVSGGGGSIAINSKNLELTEGSSLQAGIAAGLGSPEAQAGDIVINATNKVSFDGVGANGVTSGIFSSVFNQGIGNTGKIQITTGDLSFTNGGTINATLSGTGSIGDVAINASNNISLDGVAITRIPNAASTITNQIDATGSGSTGNINISAKNFSLTNGASINSFNSGKGTSGNVNIDTSDSIFVDGSLEPFVSTISSSVLETGIGDAGGINLNNNNLVVTNGGIIGSLASGKGNSGNITINARNNISLDGESKVNNDPQSSRIITSVPGEGNSGKIDISTQNLSITNGASIAATAIGNGNAGDINITATNSVSVDGKGSNEGSVSSIGSGLTQGAIGDGGNIKVATGSLKLSNNGGIFGSSTGKGNGASITLEAKEEVFLDKGTIDSSILQLPISPEQQSSAEGNGGDISITTKNISLINNSFLTSFSSVKGDGGDIRIDATEKIFLDGGNISTSVFGGNISAPNLGINLNLFGEGNSGNIDVKSGQIILDNNSKIATVNAGIGNAGNISLKANDIFSTANRSIIASNIGQLNGTPAEGKAGDVVISAKNVSLNSGSELSTGFFSNTKGESGSIYVKAIDTISLDGSGIATGVSPLAIANGSDINLEANSISIANNSQLNTSTLGVGKAGNVTINASERISLDNGFIFSTVEPGAEGNGGQVKIDTGTLNLAQGSQILTSVREAQPQNNLPGGNGNAGNVIVNAREDIKLDGILNVNQTSGIGSELQTGAKGKAGNIQISSNSLSLTNNAVLSSQTFGIGDAGNITISAVDRVSSDRSKIFSQVRDTGRGRGGDIAIATKNFSLTNGSQLVTGVFGVGEAGNVTINASDTISFDGRGSDGFLSGIFSSIEKGGKGSAGNININTKNIFLTNGGQVTAVTFGVGNAGDININASERIVIDERNEFSSGVFTSVETEGNGNGGNINLNTNNLALTNEARLSTQSSGIGNGGNIKVSADSLTLDKGSRILASNTPSQTLTTDLAGGSIELNISDILILRNGSNITARANQNANGGNVTINAPDRFIIAFPQNNDITANASQGRGGNINITAQSIFGLEERLLNPFTNDINASSEFGLQGDIAINTPDIDPTSGLINLPASVGDASDQISQNPCEQGVGSEFIITGKGGLPPNVNESLNSESTQVGLIESVPTQQQTVGANDIQPNPSATPEAVPAQGWVFNDKGEVTLTAYKTTNTGRPSFPKTPMNSCSAKPDKI